MISVKNISKTFKLYQSPSDRLKEIILHRSYHRVFQALNNVSFEVKQGETLGIIGENGAGKSTILKILTGILMPDRGSVNIDGKITGLLELGTGFNAEFSGLDNIFHNATYLGLSRNDIEKKLDEIIEFTELHEFINEPIKTYSSGMVMRLAFSVAIHADPNAFVVDEALSVGDAYFQQKCMQKIKAFKNNGGSIIFVSHDSNAVKILCDEAILLEGGNVVQQADPETIINTYNFLIAKRSKGEDIRYQGDDTSSGYGNYMVRIDDVSLQDENNNPSEILISGRPAKIVIRLAGEETIDDLTVGIGIRDKFGQDIYGTNSFHLKKKICIKKGQILLIEYYFKEFNVGPGKYTVSVALHTGDTHVNECFHWLDKSVAFEVVAGGDDIFIGFVRLKPDFHIKSETGNKDD
ncbi:lipopolysaccharide transport system ATP-binding protein [Desulfosarcina sp. BuS5]|uniref:ABC transporter ATP-binding protein n=1 Tax=Desulfosarcina sp. BuS5 TaxID=933262 RepID=UPI000485EDB4|nr:ABC transporter ATP-binding protein [Desulfosarcina sp. BuS5]WDN90738.1 lipopolysaccharide transport system ATP-binding protein [Desulfosarcina sp. BuS5]